MQSRIPYTVHRDWAGPGHPASAAGAHPKPRPGAALLAGLLVALAGCTSPRPIDRTPAAAEPGPIVSTPRPSAASTAHPLATRAALQMLAAGGSAVDASIAAQLVLGLVEPQSSGLGGGALMLVWDAGRSRLHSYDGLAAAPALSTSSLRTDVDGQLLGAATVSRGGRSVGVPGAPALLALAHGAHGRLPWPRLFEPAIELAEQGYPMAPYLHGILSRDPDARDHPEFRVDHYGADGRAHAVGTLLRNLAYAGTLRQLAQHGVEGYWRQGGAERLAAAARRGTTPSLMTRDDLLAYRARERDPLCAAVRVWKVCTVGPPSFGGIAVLQVLQLLDQSLQGPLHPAMLDDAGFWHLLAEAGRLAQADRRHWVGDPDFVAVPTATLIAPSYLRQRARLIDPTRAAPEVHPGAPTPPPVSLQPDDASTAHAETSQIVVADAGGQVVSMTTTINLNFGSRLRVDGYVLNNAMSNFGPVPAPGQHIANQMAPGKRPVTSMAPVIVFDTQGRPWVAGGSAGGGQIVDYITRNLIEMLWLGHSPAQALAGGQVTTALAPRIQLEAGTARAALAEPLRQRGHQVAVEATLSGAGFLQRAGGGWIGAADPRRDGLALGQ